MRLGALQGLGIALMAQSLVRDDLKAGALTRVLEDQVGLTLPVSLVYPTGSRFSPKVRSFVDFASSWVERLAPDAAPMSQLSPTG